jgi:hypothetical protein
LASRPGLAVRTIVVDGPRSFFDDHGGISSVTINGTHPLTLLRGPDADYAEGPHFQSLNGELVYPTASWTIDAIPKLGGAARTVASGRFTEMLVAAPWIFALSWERSPATVVRIHPETGAIDNIAALAPNVYLASLTASGDHVYAYATQLLDPKKPTENLLRISIANGSYERRTVLPIDNRHPALFRGIGGFLLRRDGDPPSYAAELYYVSEADLTVSLVSTDRGLYPAVVDAEGFFSLTTNGVDRIDFQGKRRTSLTGVPFGTAMAIDDKCMYVASGNSLLRFPRPDE